MAIAENDLPPYPVRELLATPFPERIRLICRSWAAQVGATALGIFRDVYEVRFVSLELDKKLTRIRTSIDSWQVK